jgi:multidrug efflux pump subunit AcrA (membrane-fusion protein)
MVARRDKVRVVVAVPEAEAGLVREQAPVKLRIEAAGSTPFEGKVARTSWSLAPGVRTLRAEVDLPNEQDRLRPGMYVYAQITCPSPERWTLPAAAVVKQGEAWACFLIEGGKVVRALVQVGRGDGQYTEVLKYQRPGATSWVEWTGSEEVAAKAAGLSDGQAVERGESGK